MCRNFICGIIFHTEVFTWNTSPQPEMMQHQLPSKPCLFSAWSIPFQLFFFWFFPSQISSRWTPSVSLGINWPASPNAASTSSMPSKSPRMSQPQLMISCPPWFTSCSRGTPHACSPTSSTSLASATPAGWWLGRMDIISPTWWVQEESRAWPPRFGFDLEVGIASKGKQKLKFIFKQWLRLLRALPVLSPLSSFSAVQTRALLSYFVTLNPLFEKADAKTWVYFYPARWGLSVPQTLSLGCADVPDAKSPLWAQENFLKAVQN